MLDHTKQEHEPQVDKVPGGEDETDHMDLVEGLRQGEKDKELEEMGERDWEMEDAQELMKYNIVPNFV